MKVRHIGGSVTTTANNQYLMEKDKRKGECVSGAYHWQTNAIILNQFTVECLALAVEDIINENSLNCIFYLIPDED